MAASGVLEVSDTTFSSQVLLSGVPVLVDFWAPWCGPCKMIAPIIDQLATEADGKFAVAKLNIDEASDTPVRYGVSAIPTLMVFKGGEVVSRFTGFTRKDELLRALEKAVG